MSQSTSATSPLTVENPETGNLITLTRRPLVGEIIRDPESGMDLEVVSLDPLRVEIAAEVEEDWGE